MYSEELATRFVKWKKEYQLSFDDLSILFEASKGHLFKFSKNRIGLSYELGKKIEHAIDNWSMKKTADLKARRFMNETV